MIKKFCFYYLLKDNASKSNINQKIFENGWYEPLCKKDLIDQIENLPIDYNDVVFIHFFAHGNSNFIFPYSESEAKDIQGLVWHDYQVFYQELRPIFDRFMKNCRYLLINMMAVCYSDSANLSAHASLGFTGLNNSMIDSMRIYNRLSPYTPDELVDIINEINEDRATDPNPEHDGIYILRIL